MGGGSFRSSIDMLTFMGMLALLGLLTMAVWYLLPWIMGGLAVLILLGLICRKQEGGDEK